MPIYEPGLEQSGRAQRRAAAGLSFTTDLAGAVDGAEAIFIAVGTPSRRGDGHADLSYVYDAAREIAARFDRARGDRHQIDRSGRHRRRGRADHARDRARRASLGRLQSRVSARGRGDRGFQASRPDRDRRGGRAGRGGDARGLSPALPQQGAARDHVAANGRADQICRQRLPRDQDHLHQRDGRSLRGGRRRRAGRRAGHRARSPDRRQVPACRARLWRLLLSQGHARAASRRRKMPRRRCGSSRRW